MGKNGKWFICKGCGRRRLKSNKGVRCAKCGTLELVADREGDNHASI